MMRRQDKRADHREREGTLYVSGLPCSSGIDWTRAWEVHACFERHWTNRVASSQASRSQAFCACVPAYPQGGDDRGMGRRGARRGHGPHTWAVPLSFFSGACIVGFSIATMAMSACAIMSTLSTSVQSPCLISGNVQVGQHALGVGTIDKRCPSERQRVICGQNSQPAAR